MSTIKQGRAQLPRHAPPTTGEGSRDQPGRQDPDRQNETADSERHERHLVAASPQPGGRELYHQSSGRTLGGITDAATTQQLSTAIVGAATPRQESGGKVLTPADVGSVGNRRAGWRDGLHESTA